MRMRRHVRLSTATACVLGGLMSAPARAQWPHPGWRLAPVAPVLVEQYLTREPVSIAPHVRCGAVATRRVGRFGRVLHRTAYRCR